MDMSTKRWLYVPGLLSLLAAAGLAHTDENDEPISDQVVLRLFPGASIDAFHARYGTFTLDLIPGRDIYLIQLPEALTHDQFELLVLGDTDVHKQELNFTASDPGGDTRSFYGLRNENEYLLQGAAANMNLNQARSLATGRGVTVAILDTGLDSQHTALIGSVQSGWNFITDSQDTRDIPRGTDSSANGIPDEFVGHGTMIAGMIRLVAPDAEILPVVVLDSDGRTTSFRVAKGIYYAIDHRVNIINLSLGTSVDTSVLLDAVDEARRHWITVVASAGNLGQGGAPQYPAAMQDNRAIAVAASDLGGQLTPFSNVGDHITVGAPGVETISSFPGGGYQIGDGSSFSAAWVTGVAALIHSVGWDHSPGNVSRVIERSARPYTNLPAPLTDLVGGGVLDAETALLDHLAEPGCPADINDDELVSPADFSAWIDAFQHGDFAADQNRDRQLTPADFSAWIANFNLGCP